MRVRPRGLLLAAGAVALVAAAALAWVVQPLVAEPARVEAPDVNTAALRRHVVMLSRLLAPRSHAHHANLAAAGAYVAQELARSGARVRVQTFDVGGRSFSNYSALFGPGTGARVVVGAHYDAYESTPGADDNASGVAALLELARILGQEAPSQGVELVAFTLAEPPHFRGPDMGSARHAEALSRAGVPLRLMISLESIGHFSDAPGSQRYPLPLLDWLYPDRGDFVAVVGRLAEGRLARQLKAAMRSASNLAVHSINAPAAVAGIDFSDHLNYWAQGYPALMVTDTAMYRNRRHHQAGDTAETLDYERMAAVVKGVAAYLRQGAH